LDVVSFLWLNFIGALLTVMISMFLQLFMRKKPEIVVEE
jgi:membrane protein DedA with SNARE-associated domain